MSKSPPVRACWLGSAGYRTVSPEEMILLRDHGVSTGFIHEIVAMGYGDFTPHDLARLRDHGLSAEAVRRAASLGHKLTVDEIIRLRDSGNY